MFTNLWKKLTGGETKVTTRTPASTKPRRTQLRLEGLETREVLSSTSLSPDHAGSSPYDLYGIDPTYRFVTQSQPQDPGWTSTRVLGGGTPVGMVAVSGGMDHGQADCVALDASGHAWFWSQWRENQGLGGWQFLGRDARYDQFAQVAADMNGNVFAVKTTYGGLGGLYEHNSSNSGWWNVSCTDSSGISYEYSQSADIEVSTNQNTMLDVIYRVQANRQVVDHLSIDSTSGPFIRGHWQTVYSGQYVTSLNATKFGDAFFVDQGAVRHNTEGNSWSGVWAYLSIGGAPYIDGGSISVSTDAAGRETVYGLDANGNVFSNGLYDSTTHWHVVDGGHKGYNNQTRKVLAGESGIVFEVNTNGTADWTVSRNDVSSYDGQFRYHQVSVPANYV